MKKTTKKNLKTAGKVAAIGVGVAALGAGAYYFLGPNGKKHQKKAEVWMTKMEKEVVTKVKKAKNMTEPVYHKAVDALATTYSTQYKAHAPQIKAFAKMLKSEWKKTSTKAKPAVKQAKKSVKKAVGAVKKVVTKKKSK